MDKILEFLNTNAFTLGGNEFSVMRLLFIPLVLIANSALLENTVVNWTLIDRGELEPGT